MKALISVSLYVLTVAGAVTIPPGTQAQVSRRATATNDSLLSGQIRKLLDPGTADLNYPKSTAAYYRGRGYRPVWQLDQPDDAVWESLFFIECAIQYGLNRQNYHPEKLTCEQLYKVSEGKDPKARARFDLYLTDAMLTFINNLHYGRLNVKFPPTRLDNEEVRFANAVLANALRDSTFCEVVEAAQPKFEEYRLLQDYMRLLTGQYIGDSYEINEAQIRQVAANLERWRWEEDPGKTFVAINIPAFTLTFHDRGTTALFKVIVGRPGNPTPVLSSRITWFQTAPNWNVPERIFRKELLPRALKNPAYLKEKEYVLYDKKGNRVSPTRENLGKIAAGMLKVSARQSGGCDNSLGNLVFRFPNTFSVYLHDTPFKSFFRQDERAFSHGCIRLQDPERLARLLLLNDGGQQFTAFENAWSSSSRKDFTLKRPVIIITRYFTCEIRDGILIGFSDVYKRDEPVSRALLGDSGELKRRLDEYASRSVEKKNTASLSQKPML